MSTENLDTESSWSSDQSENAQCVELVVVDQETYSVPQVEKIVEIDRRSAESTNIDPQIPLAIPIAECPQADSNISPEFHRVSNEKISATNSSIFPVELFEKYSNIFL